MFKRDIRAAPVFTEPLKSISRFFPRISMPSEAARLLFARQNNNPGEVMTKVLDDIRPHVRFKLFALWTSVTLCYLYADYFGLYVPGVLQSILDGQMGPLGETTQGVLVGTGILLLIPCVMPFLSLILPPKLSRITNIVFGVIYTVVILITIPGAWYFYQMYCVVEALLTALVVWYAWTWPTATTEG